MASNPYDQFDANPYDQFDSAPPESPGVLGYAAGIPDAALHLGANLVMTPLAGIAGLGTMAGNAVGITNANPADVVNSVQGAAYEPKTEGGRRVAGVVSYPFRKFGEFADWSGDKARQGAVALGASPEAAAGVGTAVNTGIQAVPMALGYKYGKQGGITKPPKQVEPAVAEATDAGFKLTPRQAGGTAGQVAESLSNSAKLERSLSKENATRVNDIVREEVGLPKDAPITRKEFQKAKEPYSRVYKEVASLPPLVGDDALAQAIQAVPERSGMGIKYPGNVSELKQQYLERIKNPTDMQAVLDEVRQLRKEGYSAKKGPYDPAKHAEADAKIRIADALDAQIERHIKATEGARPGLFAEYKAARQKLAVIDSATKAVRGGNVDASLLFKQKEKGVPLSGGLRTVANAYENFDRAFQNPSRLRNTGPFDTFDAAIGAGFGLANPALFASIFGRPLVRNALASDLYQRTAIAGQNGYTIPYSAGILPPAVEQARVGNDSPLFLPSK